MDVNKKETHDFLHIYQKNGTIRTYPLKSGKTNIGTTSTSDIRLKNEDKLNCVLESDISGVFVLTNDQQDERIIVNGKICNKYIVLKNGDFIHVGKQKFQYTNDREEEELKVVQQSKQRQIGRKSVFLPISRQGTPKLKRLSAAKRTPIPNNDLKKPALTNETTTPSRNPLSNRRSSTGNRRVSLRNAVLSSMNASGTAEEERTSVCESRSLANIFEEPIERHVSNRRSVSFNKTPNRNKNMNRRFSTSNTSATPNSNPALNVLRTLRSSSVTRSIKENDAREVNVLLTLPQNDNTVNLEESENEPTSDNDSKQLAKSSDSLTPRNNVSAISITPLKVSKKSSNKSFVEDSKSSTPKSALNPRRSAFSNRPIGEDVSPVTPRLRPIRPSTLKKPTFMQRRSMNLNHFDSYNETDSVDGESLNDSDTESAKLRPRSKSLSPIKQTTLNEPSMDPAQILAGKENQSENSFHSCPDQDETDNIEDLFKTPQQVPPHRFINTFKSKTSLAERPSSETDDDLSEIKKIPHRLGDSDIGSDSDNFVEGTSLAETTSMNDESFATEDLTDNDDISEFRQSLLSVDNADATSKRRSSLARTLNWVVEDSPQLSRNRSLNIHLESSADETDQTSKLWTDKDDNTSLSSERTSRRSSSLTEGNGPKMRRYSGANKDLISKSFSCGEKISRRSSQRLRRQSVAACPVHDKNSSNNWSRFKKMPSTSGKVSNTGKEISPSRSISTAEFSFGDVTHGGSSLANAAPESESILTETTSDDDYEPNRRSLALIQDYSSNDADEENVDTEAQNGEDPALRIETISSSNNETSPVIDPLPEDEDETLDIRQSASFEKGQNLPAPSTPEIVINEETNNDDSENIRLSPSFTHRQSENIIVDQTSNVDLSACKDAESECYSNDISYSNIDSSFNEDDIESSLVDSVAADVEKTDVISSKQWIDFPENLEDAAEFMEAPPSNNDSIQEYNESVEEQNESNDVPSLRLSTGNNSINDESDKVQTTPRGIDTKEMTKRREKSPLNDLSNPVGVKTLMATPKIQKSPANDLTNVNGVKSIMATPKPPKSPLNDLTNPVGVKTLLKTPKRPKSPLNDLTNPVGVKALMKTPCVPKSPLNDLTNPVGVKTLLKTPKAPKSPLNDLTNPVGVKTLLKTPKAPKSPLNDLTNPVGVKTLLQTPKAPKSPLNDLTNPVGVKTLLKTPKAPQSPLNDLTNPVGVKALMKTPRIQKTPKNDLTNVGGVKSIFSTPKKPKSPLNDLTDLVGVKDLMATPTLSNSPSGDVTNPVEVKTLMATPTNQNSLKGENSLTPQTLVQQVDTFDSLLKKKPMRTYSRTPKKSFNQNEASPNSSSDSVEMKEMDKNETSVVEKTEETNTEIQDAETSKSKKIRQKGVSNTRRGAKTKQAADNLEMPSDVPSSTPVTPEITTRSRRYVTRKALVEKEQGNESLKTNKETPIKGRRRIGAKNVKNEVEQKEASPKTSAEVDEVETNNITEVVDENSPIKQRTRRAQANKSVETINDDEVPKSRGKRTAKKVIEEVEDESMEVRKRSKRGQMKENVLKDEIPKPSEANEEIKNTTANIETAEDSEIEKTPKKTLTKPLNKKSIDENELESPSKPLSTRGRKKRIPEIIESRDSSQNEDILESRTRRGKNKIVENDKEIEDGYELKQEVKPKCPSKEIEQGNKNEQTPKPVRQTRQKKTEEKKEQTKNEKTPKPVRQTRQKKTEEKKEEIKTEDTPKLVRRTRQKKTEEETKNEETPMSVRQTRKKKTEVKGKETEKEETPKSVRQTRKKKTEEKEEETKTGETPKPVRQTRQKKNEEKKEEETKNEATPKPARRTRQKKTEVKIQTDDKEDKDQKTAEPRSRKAKKVDHEEAQLDTDDDSKTASKSTRAKKAKILKLDSNEDPSLINIKNTIKDVKTELIATPQTDSPRRTARKRMANNKYGEEWVTPIKTPAKSGDNSTRRKASLAENLSDDSCSEPVIRRTKRQRK